MNFQFVTCHEEPESVLFLQEPKCVERKGEMKMGFEQEVQLSITVLLAGLVIVFVMLVLLTYLIKGYSAAVKSFLPKNGIPNKVEVPTAVQMIQPVSPTVEKTASDGISEEVVAAISAAVYTMYGMEGAKITSIRRTAQPARSAWATAGLLENTRPF